MDFDRIMRIYNKLVQASCLRDVKYNDKWSKGEAVGKTEVSSPAKEEEGYLEIKYNHDLDRPFAQRLSIFEEVFSQKMSPLLISGAITSVLSFCYFVSRSLQALRVLNAVKLNSFLHMFATCGFALLCCVLTIGELSRRAWLSSKKSSELESYREFILKFNNHKITVVKVNDDYSVVALKAKPLDPSKKIDENGQMVTSVFGKAVNEEKKAAGVSNSAKDERIFNLILAIFFLVICFSIQVMSLLAFILLDSRNHNLAVITPIPFIFLFFSILIPTAQWFLINGKINNTDFKEKIGSKIEYKDTCETELLQSIKSSGEKLDRQAKEELSRQDSDTTLEGKFPEDGSICKLINFIEYERLNTGVSNSIKKIIEGVKHREDFILCHRARDILEIKKDIADFHHIIHAYRKGECTGHILHKITNNNTSGMWDSNGRVHDIDSKPSDARLSNVLQAMELSTIFDVLRQSSQVLCGRLNDEENRNLSLMLSSAKFNNRSFLSNNFLNHIWSLMHKVQESIKVYAKPFDEESYAELLKILSFIDHIKDEKSGGAKLLLGISSENYVLPGCDAKDVNGVINVLKSEINFTKEEEEVLELFIQGVEDFNEKSDEFLSSIGDTIRSVTDCVLEKSKGLGGIEARDKVVSDFVAEYESMNDRRFYVSDQWFKIRGMYKEIFDIWFQSTKVNEALSGGSKRDYRRVTTHYSSCVRNIVELFYYDEDYSRLRNLGAKPECELEYIKNFFSRRHRTEFEDCFIRAFHDFCTFASNRGKLLDILSSKELDFVASLENFRNQIKSFAAGGVKKEDFNAVVEDFHKKNESILEKFTPADSVEINSSADKLNFYVEKRHHISTIYREIFDIWFKNSNVHDVLSKEGLKQDFSVQADGGSRVGDQEYSECVRNIQKLFYHDDEMEECLTGISISRNRKAERVGKMFEHFHRTEFEDSCIRAFNMVLQSPDDLPSILSSKELDLISSLETFRDKCKSFADGDLTKENFRSAVKDFHEKNKFILNRSFVSSELVGVDSLENNLPAAKGAQVRG